MSEQPKTAIQLENRNGTYRIEASDDLQTLAEVVDLLIRPVLLAASYTENTVDDYIGDGK